MRGLAWLMVGFLLAGAVGLNLGLGSGALPLDELIEFGLWILLLACGLVLAVNMYARRER